MGRNLEPRGPGHTVQHRCSEAVIRHVCEEVKSREAKAATAFRTIKGPREMLWLAHLHISQHVGVATVRTWLVAFFELHRV